MYVSTWFHNVIRQFQQNRWLWRYRVSVFDGFVGIAIGLLALIGLLSFLNPLDRGLRASYYDNVDWNGTPLLVTKDQQSSLHRMERVFPTLTSDYSIRWEGFLFIPKAGDYTFTLISDDGSSMFLDQQLLVDNGGFHGKQERSAQRYLNQGFHALQINYMQGKSLALFRAYWTPPGKRQEALSQTILTTSPLGPRRFLVARSMEAVIFLGKILCGICIIGAILTVCIRYRSIFTHLATGPIGVGVFLTIFISHFFWSDITTSYDSRWSVHTALSLLREGNTDLDEYALLTRQYQDYSLEQHGGHTYSIYPIGTALLALPAVLLVDAFMQSGWFLDTEQFINEYLLIPTGIEKFAATSIVALTAVFLYLISAMLCRSQACALVVTFIFGFCTSAWSTASRALWQHGPTMLVLSLALYLLVVAEKFPRYAPWTIRCVSLPLAFSFVIRPTNSVPIAIFTVFIFIIYRRYFLSYCLWSLWVVVPFLLYNLHVYQTILPPYYLAKGQLGSGLGVFFEALAGTLVSPSRGLFIFTPVLLFALYGMVLIFRSGQAKLLDYALVSTLVLHWMLSASHPNWWAGHCYGPRYLSDMLPLWLYFLPPAVHQLGTLHSRKRVVLAGLLIVTIGISFFIHYRGATNEAVHSWNAGPVNVDVQPSRVWDWGDVQFLRGL